MPALAGGFRRNQARGGLVYRGACAPGEDPTTPGRRDEFPAGAGPLLAPDAGAVGRSTPAEATAATDAERRKRHPQLFEESCEATAKSIWTTLGQALEFMREPGRGPDRRSQFG